MTAPSTAADALDPRCLIVAPDLRVDELARQLDTAGVPGAVVMQDTALVGIVTEMDLVVRNKRIHLPSWIAIFDAVIPFDPGGRAQAEFEKATGVTVGEIMTEVVVTAKATDPLAEVAGRMVDRHLSLVPVLDEGGRLMGVVTRRSAMRQAFRPAAD